MADKSFLSCSFSCMLVGAFSLHVISFLKSFLSSIDKRHK